jgi:hypothetical protein
MSSQHGPFYVDSGNRLFEKKCYLYLREYQNFGIQSLHDRLTITTCTISDVSLHEELTNPANLYNIGSVDRLLLGLCEQPAQKRDEFITEELTNHLFQTPSMYHNLYCIVVDSNTIFSASPHFITLLHVSNYTMKHKFTENHK